MLRGPLGRFAPGGRHGENSSKFGRRSANHGLHQPSRDYESISRERNTNSTWPTLIEREILPLFQRWGIDIFCFVLQKGFTKPRGNCSSAHDVRGYDFLDNNWRVDKPLAPKSIYCIVRDAAKRAGITKHVSPHSMRHYFESPTITE